MRHAALLICDELLFSLTGKMTIAGLYTGDIGIGSERQIIPQLIFLFVVEGDLDEPIQSAVLEVALPKVEVKRRPLPGVSPPAATPGRTKWKMLLPFPMSQVELHLGKIEAKVIYDKGEIVATAPWIVQLPQASPAKA